MQKSRLSRFLPMFAIATGVALVTVTSAFKEQPKDSSRADMLTFEYNAPGGTDYSETSVEAVANWSYTPDNSPCSNDDVKACRIFVPNSSTYIGSGNTLKPAINIVTGGTTSQAYVDHTAAGSGDTYVSNKLN